MKKWSPASHTSPPSTVPGGRDPVQLGEPPAERRAECCHLSGAAGSTGAGEDRAPAGDDGGILDEGGVGKLGSAGSLTSESPRRSSVRQ